MVLRLRIRREWRQRGGAMILCGLCCVLTPVVFGRAPEARAVALTAWERAERGLETLEAIPPGTRTRADYSRALDGFRAVYHEAPGDAHAPDSVNEVAELLAEQGRAMQDAKMLKAAVGQYEFLRSQYPASSLRVEALLAEAQIFENDLHDPAAAQERYALLVKEYPRSVQAEEARAGMESLDHAIGHKIGHNDGHTEESTAIGARVGDNRSGDTNGQQVAGVGGSRVARMKQGDGTSPASADGRQMSSFAPMPVTRDQTLAGTGKTGSGNMVGAVGGENQAVDPLTGSSSATAVPVPLHIARTTANRRGEITQVTGIRHWSTPNYTRVAIDLGDDVTYEAARVPNPDRIYFDLHGARLAQELVGKSFTVTDDGFLKKIRAAQFSNDMTRVVLDVNDVTEYSAFLLPNPYRLIIDIHGAGKAEPGARAVAAPVQRAATAAPTVPNTTAVRSTSSVEVAALSTQPGKVEATSQPTSKPISAVVKEQSATDDGSLSDKSAAAAPVNSTPDATAKGSTRKSKRSKVDTSALPARAAVPTADGETSLVRTLGLKIGRIVIDAGHGGHDSGTLGVDGIEEKDVVLDVALRLGKLLHERLGSEIIYTRSDDTFIPLETRTAIANKAQADLFLSIHANSSSDATARGVESYYLNFTSMPDALETAARENAVSDQSIHQLSDLVKKIALKDKIAESREFAGDVEDSLYGGLQKGNPGLKDRGVKKAPFVVLIGANMPSILAEISFVTNEKDARQLREPDYRERVAESLYKGVARYASGLSGAHQPTERASGN